MQTTHYHLNITRNICSLDTFFSIVVHPNPVITLLDTLVATCSNDSVLIGTAVSNINNFYSWSSFNGFISYDPLVKVLPTGFNFNIYTLSLTDTNGCTSSKSVQVNIKQAPSQYLCMVSVDSTSTHNIVVWEKLDKGATDSFYLYREITTNNYMQIAALGRNDLSEYHDYAANPNTTGYRYKIAVRDTCGNVSSLSLYHNSIHLQYLGSGNLQWNIYDIESQITPVASYDIYRDSSGAGTWQLILTVSGTQNTATDPNFALYPNAKYRVQANWSYTCTSSRSIFTGVLSNVIRNQVNGLSEAKNMGTIEISPNPTKAYLYITLPKSAGSKITLTDMAGKVLSILQTSGKDSETINLEVLPSGVYVLLYQDAEVCVSKKIVKQ